jgi:phenylacetate-CoA ligase
MECEHGNLHQNTEFCRVDLAPLGSAPASREGVSRIFVTTFRNGWFPLVRFDIGDIARVAPGPSLCGRDFGMTLTAIEGRLKSLCIAADGRLVTHREIDSALACVEGLEEYGLLQEGLNTIRLAVVGEDGQEKRAARDAAEILQDLFGQGVEITVNQVHALLPEKSGKFLLVKRDFPLDPFIAETKARRAHG